MSDEEQKYFLNSFYCRGKWGRDASTGKSVRLQNDFMQIMIKDCKTNETELKFIESPHIDFYMVRDEFSKQYQYPRMSIDINHVEKVRCKYADKEKTMAEKLNITDSFYDACRRGRQFDYTINREVDYKREFVQEHILNSPKIYMGDIDVEDYYKNLFMENHGRDVYHKHGCFNHAFADIECDQFYDHWNISDKSAPINSISYFYKPSNTLYILALKNQPENEAIDEVEQNFSKFLDEYVKPHAYDDSIKYVSYFYNSEEKLLMGFWNLVHETKPDFVGIWNMNFDMPYIFGRMTELGMDIINICSHPDVPKQFRYVKYIEDSKRRTTKFTAGGGGGGDAPHPSRLWDWVHISGYSQFYDMMALYSLLRKRFILSSYKLDDISETETGYGKLDFHKMGYTIRKLAHQDFKIFLSYSMIDTLRLHQIEEFTDDFNRFIIFADNNKLQTSVKISYVIKNKMYRIYGDQNPKQIIGNNVTYDVKEKITGAVVASPENLNIKGRGILNSSGYIYEDVVDFDEASEYPRVIITFNISKNSIHSRIIKIEVGDREINNPTEFNKLLQTRMTSIFEIGEKYFDLPSVEDMIKKIEGLYDSIKR
ncbi:MAG: 3'-5' exonuclease [Anaeroplasmataceae bacterium]